MRNSWAWTAVTSVAIAGAGAAWAQAPDSAQSNSAERPHALTPETQANDTQSGTQDETGHGGANSGPSPRDPPAPGLRLDDRMKRLPAQRHGKGSNGAQGDDAQGGGAENGSGNGEDNAPGGSDNAPQNPANPPTPIFPANPHPPADPGQPGNPVTPTNLPAAPTNLRFA